MKPVSVRIDRKRWLWFGAGVSALWLSALWVHGTRAPASGHATRGAKAAESEPRTPSRTDHAARERRRDDMFAGFGPRSVEQADLIESVSVDKPRVCAGEDFAVSVRGKPKNAGSRLPIAELNFNVAGKFGNPILLRAWDQGTQRYVVVASNGVDKVEHEEFEVEVAAPDAPECAKAPLVALEVERSGHDQDAVRASIRSTRGLVPPLSYEWDFGDGAEASTTQDTVEHSYALRDQARGIANYLVQVLVTDAAGRQAVGRDSVHLSNAHYRARAFGNRLTKTVYDPFPKPAARGYRFDVAFRNLEHDPVSYERATLTQRSCLAGQADRVTELSPKDLSAPSLLGAKATQHASLIVPSALVAADACVLEVELTGDSIPPRTGEPMETSPVRYREVSTRLTFELRAAPPLEQGGAEDLASQRVDDPAIAAKVLAASRVLGSSRVTPQQVAQLERDGRLH